MKIIPHPRLLGPVQSAEPAIAMLITIAVKAGTAACCFCAAAGMSLGRGAEVRPERPLDRV